MTESAPEPEPELADAFDVDCPVCDAVAGEPCDWFPARYGVPHADRHYAANGTTDTRT